MRIQFSAGHLLTTFNKYVELFAHKFNVPVLGRDANMTSAHAEGITIINFGAYMRIKASRVCTDNAYSLRIAGGDASAAEYALVLRCCGTS